MSEPWSPFDEAFLRSLSRLAFAVRRLRAREGKGRATADRRGGRVEFADRRAYAPGDDPRFVDWHAYARTGRLLVKEFERREELDVVLVVDASGSMGLHGKLVAAQRLAYALAYLALAAGHRVRCGLASGGALRLSGEVAGTQRIGALGEFLASSSAGAAALSSGSVSVSVSVSSASASASAASSSSAGAASSGAGAGSGAASAMGATRLGASLRNLPGARRGSRLLVLISDLLSEDDGRAALAARALHGDDVAVLHVSAAADRALPDDEPVVVEDVETGERVALSRGAATLAGHDAARREGEWRGFAARHGLRYVPLEASAPTEELVLRWLRSGGVLA